MRFYKTTILILLLLSVFLVKCNDSDTIAVNLKDGKNSDEAPFLLEQNYPNPFYPSTSISFRIEKEMDVKMKLYSEDWVEIKTFWEGHVDMYFPNESVHSNYKSYSISFDCTDSFGNSLPTGDYYYTLEGDGYTQIRMMTIIK